jgi:RecA/RadA recombinase
MAVAAGTSMFLNGRLPPRRRVTVGGEKKAVPQIVPKIATGIPGFDELSRGGLPRNRTTPLKGGPGSGRTVFTLLLLAQEFLADMLGVRRVAVTKFAVALKQRKLIRYSRDKIRILDRKGLEAAGYYEIVKDLQNSAQTV